MALVFWSSDDMIELLCDLFVSINLQLLSLDSLIEMKYMIYWMHLDLHLFAVLVCLRFGKTSRWFNTIHFVVPWLPLGSAVVSTASLPLVATNLQVPMAQRVMQNGLSQAED